jgi:arginase family enzyme
LRTEPVEIGAALDGTEGVYVALDADALEPDEVSPFMPETGGLSLGETEQLLARIPRRAPVLGAGLSGLAAEVSNIQPLTRLCAALGL